MNMIVMKSPNYFINGLPIKAVVMHGTAGSLNASLSWLCNPQPSAPDNAVSSNYVISKSGVIYQLVDWQAGKRAWANGRVENFDHTLKWLSDAVKDKVNPNMITVSIEHEASEEDMLSRASMPGAQFNASINLAAFILTLAGLKANHETICTHSQISGTQKYNCPGVIFTPAYTEVLLNRYPRLK